MNSVLQQAFVNAQTLSEFRQNEIGSMLLDLVEQDHSEITLSQLQQDEVRRRLSGVEDLVPSQEMDDFFAKLTE